MTVLLLLAHAVLTEVRHAVIEFTSVGCKGLELSRRAPAFIRVDWGSNQSYALTGLVVTIMMMMIAFKFYTYYIYIALCSAVEQTHSDTAVEVRGEHASFTVSSACASLPLLFLCARLPSPCLPTYFV